MPVHWAAAENERPTVEVGHCVHLPTPEQRLGCFDAHVEAARPLAAARPEVRAKIVELRETSPDMRGFVQVERVR
jgi:hypothetical protein